MDTTYRAFPIEQPKPRFQRPLALIAILVLIGLLFLSIATKTKSSPKNSNKVIAIVDDSMDFAQSLGGLMGTIITDGQFSYYLNCEHLLAEMSTGKRFLLYLVDLVPEHNHSDGYICTMKIISIDPNAKIVGMSKVSDLKDLPTIKRIYLDSGAQDFFNKSNTGLKVIEEIILPLLK